MGSQYHVVIVGGGLSGLVATARLSEDDKTKVLGIEAGADRRGDLNIDTPGLLLNTRGNSDYDWNFWSVPQVCELTFESLCKKMTVLRTLELRSALYFGRSKVMLTTSTYPVVKSRDSPSRQSRGKVLGGSSAINATAFLFPDSQNFQIWAKLGNQGWTAERMMPYYRKFMTYHAPSEKTNSMMSLDSYMQPDLYGQEGPIQASFAEFGPLGFSRLSVAQNRGTRRATQFLERVTVSSRPLPQWTRKNEKDPTRHLRT